MASTTLKYCGEGGGGGGGGGHYRLRTEEHLTLQENVPGCGGVWY